MNSTPRSRDDGATAREPAGDPEMVLVGTLPPGCAWSDFPTVVAPVHDTVIHPVNVAPPHVSRPEALNTTPARSVGRWSAGWLGRMTRRTAALVLLLVVLWFWAVPFLFPVTSRSVVNARTVQIRAPIGGDVTELTRGIGDPVTAGQPLMRVAGRRFDPTHLSTLRTRRAELIARRERLDRDLKDTLAGEAACLAELERYKRAMVATLRATNREVEARVRIAEIEHDGAQRQFGRVQELSVRHAVGVQEHDANRDGVTLAKAKIDLEQAALSRTAEDLGAAEAGLFLNRDTSHPQIQVRDLALKIPRLRAELRETEQLLEPMAEAVRAEERRVDQLTDAPVSAPVSGVVWKRPGNLKQTVAENEAVYEVADGTTVFVEALLHQRYLHSVARGSRATVILTGGTTLTGRVRAVRTPNPDEVEAGFALSLSDRDVKQVKVVIGFDPPVADAALIGRHARVLITGADPTLVERGVEWLFTRMRF